MHLLWGGTPENGVTAQEDTAATTIPFEGTTITKGGNYEIPEGKYAGNITVNLTDTSEPVNIAIKGGITYNGTQQVMFINVKNADEVTITNDGHEVNCKPSDAHFLDVSSGNVTVNGGTYVTATRNVVMAYAGTTTLNDMTTETSGYAVTSSGSAKVVVNRGTHTHSNTNQNRANFWIFNGGHMTLNDVTATSEEPVIINSTGTVDVNGGDFQTTGTKSCFVNNSANLTINKGSTTDGTFVSEGASCIDNNWGQVRINGGSFTTDAGIAVKNHGGLRLNGGTVEAPNGTAIDISGESGDVQLNGGTIRNSVTGVRVADAGDSEIDLKAVTFENNTDDISLGNDQQINIKKSFAGTAKIRVDDPARGRQITTDNEDSPYQKNLNLISRNEGYVIGCKKVTDGVEFRYLAPADGCIVTAEDAVATADLGAGEQTLDSTTVVPVGTPVTVTAVQPGNGTFMGWTVQREDGSVVTDLLNPSEDDETTAAFTMPDYNVKVMAVYQTDIIDPGEGGSGDGCGIVGAVLAGGVLAWGAYEAGTDIYRVVSMQGAPMPTDRIELAKLLWEKAGKPEPEAVVVTVIWRMKTSTRTRLQAGLWNRRS